MNEIAKSSLTVEGKNLHMSMPFAKVDEAKRLVSGFATLNNIDTQGDVVTAEASKAAFERARGNIREMHQSIAVGKMVDFFEDEFYDENSGEFYRGIHVTARVSEGAEDTWKKVLDGTLTGFSIGGEINEASNEFVKDANGDGKKVRFIKDYDLVELSLVDNPANQLANVLSIQKTQTGSVVKGMAAETRIETVFVCSKHDSDVIAVRESDSENCPLCGLKMDNAGWFETGSNRTEKVQGIVEAYLNPEQEAAPISNSEGGVVMGVEKNATEVTEPVAEEVVETPEVEEEETTDPEVETAEEVDETKEPEAETPEEVEDEGEVIAKAIDELKETVQSSLEKTRTETAETIAGLEKKIEAATAEFTSKTSELEKQIGEFGNKLDTAKGRLANLEDALEKFNKSAAVRKSADLSDEPAAEVVQKNASWDGAFSGRREPRFSVNTLMQD